MLRAKDVMTKDVISLKENTPIFTGLQCLLDNSISGVPVVDDDMMLLGILSEKDLLRLFYSCNSMQGRTVADFMSRPAVNFDENESLLDVCDCLVGHWFRRVPVTSNGKVVGIISRPDIIRFILELRREDCVAAANVSGKGSSDRDGKSQGQSPSLLTLLMS